MTNGASEDQQTQDRNERLGVLRSRTEEWADQEIERLEYEKEYLESVLSGRAPGGQLQDHIRSFTSELVGDEIDSFLEAE